MKIRITEKGVHDTKGNAVLVGTILEIAGNSIPHWLANKAVPAGDDDAPVIVNPAAGADTPLAANADEAEKAFLSEYAVLLGITVNAGWTLDQLKAAIQAAEKGAQ